MSLPAGTIRALLDTSHVSEATRAALLPRFAPPPYTPRYFSKPEYMLLQAVAARLFPQPDRETPIELAPGIDQRLAENRSDGWRYDVLPPDGQTLRQGLAGIEEAAQQVHQRSFLDISEVEQDAVLQAVQAGTVRGGVWQKLSAARFFEELLTEMTELYYCHPLAQEEIGYLGMADRPGWVDFGLK